jgi:membrane-associated phospholipid phosphatase
MKPLEPLAGTNSQIASATNRDAASGPREGSPAVRRPALARLIWLILLLAVLAAAVWSYDQVFSDGAVANRDKIENVLGLPAAACMFLIPLAILFSFPNWRRLMIGFAAPLLLSGVVTQVIKWLVGRARPDMRLGPQAFDRVQSLSRGEYQSFPSGDATTAITLALLLGLYFPRARWVFYVCAGFVGLHRILLARHFTSDVLVGYMVGAAAVYVCVRLLGPTFYERDWPRPARDLTESA